MSSGRILIVDDSDNIRNVLQMNFEWLGYEVMSANDGEEALRMIGEDPPDLVILDVMMPRRNGYQVCRTLKADPLLRKIPVIFLTAKDQKEDRFWGKDCGADEYLTKPFSAATLERVIERLLEAREREGVTGDITARLTSLRAQGQACAVAQFRLDRKALGVFRQKYGEIQYQEMLEGLAKNIEGALRSDGTEHLLERHGESGFKMLIHGGEAPADALVAQVKKRADLYLRGLYNREDSERGYVVSRANPSGMEVHIPLLALERADIVETTAA
jgi:DNA-binding response OmpR family regulator